MRRMNKLAIYKFNKIFFNIRELYSIWDREMILVMIFYKNRIEINIKLCNDKYYLLNIFFLTMIIILCRMKKYFSNFSDLNYYYNS